MWWRVILRVERGSTVDLDQPRGQIMHLNGDSCGCAQPQLVDLVVLPRLTLQPHSHVISRWLLLTFDVTHSMERT